MAFQMIIVKANNTPYNEEISCVSALLKQTYDYNIKNR